ncbi:MAG: hypothetical protein JWR50_3950 [Mucilaginibacter sp.]|nr:hypothetical protein [Mucilaginibacter sp.]
MKLLTIFLIAALSISTCFAQTREDTLKAADIISKSENAYAHLKTYADSGKLIQTMVVNGMESKTALIFKTAYTNTGGFNFEYYTVGKSNSLYTINRTDNVVKTWWGITGQESTPKGISNAIAAAAGVSSSTSTIIPELLMPNDFKMRNCFQLLKTYTLAGVEPVNGKACFKIKGDGAFGITAIWVGKKDFLIMKIETEKVIDPAKVEANSLKIARLMEKKDSVRYKEAIKANKTIADINKRDSLRGAPRGSFTVKDTYVFVPVTNHKINPELLKYRPKREVSL